MDCWHHEIDKAKTEAEIVNSACDYLMLWAPRELDPVQIGLAEMRIETPDDIERVKRWLGDAAVEARNGNNSKAHMKELAKYFSHASCRIGEIRRHAA